jgi:hypothetical protein
MAVLIEPQDELEWFSGASQRACDQVLVVGTGARFMSSRPSWRYGAGESVARYVRALL